MHIPGDPLNRSWVEAVSVNTDLRDVVRPALVSFVAACVDRVYRVAGTGFIIGASDEYACVLSARHVLVDGAARFQNPYRNPAPNLFGSPLLPSLEKERLRAIWADSNNAEFLTLPFMNFNDALDIASCIVLPQDQGQKLGFTQVLLDTNVPTVGDIVYMFSHDTHTLEETVAPVDATGAGQTFQISRSISMRAGVVTGVYQQGYRQYRWPCFTTTIPAEPGMSGGFVARRIDGPIAACGIVCADASPEECRRDYLKAGESIIASTWPALALQLPLVFPMENPAIKPIYKFMAEGDFPLPVGGLDHISIEQGEGDDWSIKRRGRTS